MSRWVGLAATLCLAVFAGQASAADTKIIGQVTIGDGTYYVVDVRDVANKIPNATVQAVSRLSRFCRTSGIHAYAGSASDLDAGVVAWLPTNPADCLGVTGGGGREFCFRQYRTPNPENGRSYVPYWVVIVATSNRMCAKLSTQVPGGIWAPTNQSVPLPGGRTLSAGTPVLITCQRATSQGLNDYVLLNAPAKYTDSRQPYWISDSLVDTNSRTVLAGVPSC